MTEENARGNAWTADFDSEELRRLANVSASLSSYAQKRMLWVHDDPTHGDTAADESELGRHLMLIGQELRQRADKRMGAARECGPAILRFLGRLGPGERVALPVITAAVLSPAELVEMALNDLVLAGAISAQRGRLRASPGATVFLLTEKGRDLLSGGEPDPRRRRRSSTALLNDESH